MPRKLRQFLALSPLEKGIFFESFLHLAWMRLAIKMVRFERLVRGLNQHKTKDWIALLPMAAMNEALLISRTLHKAANNTPWESACLVRALAARKMLQQRNIPGIIFLGVRKEETGTGAMQAHAWTVAGESLITGGAEHDTYQVISLYSWDFET